MQMWGYREGIGFYVVFNGLGHILERNSLLFTYSSKGSFSCRSTIDRPPQCHTFISSNQANPSRWIQVTRHGNH